MKRVLSIVTLILVLIACKKEESEDNGPNLIFKLKFDPNQKRLDSKGQEIIQLPDTHAAQTPTFNGMSAHYIELTPSAITLPGDGERVFEGATITNQGTVNVGGNELDPIDWSKAIVKDEGEVFYSLPIKNVKAGSYPYIRVSVTHQNFDIRYDTDVYQGLSGTISSFVGYGQYISNLKIKDESISVNNIKTQGFWALEDHISNTTYSGQSPAGSTTVPNPLFNTSEIAQGSCLVTGVFDEAFEITGNETEDVIIELSFSVNQSFEWHDANDNDKFDVGEQVVDMGLRGLKPIVE